MEANYNELRMIAQKFQAEWHGGSVSGLNTASDMLTDLLGDTEVMPEKFRTHTFEDFEKKVQTLYEAIKHGNEKHQKWLSDAIFSHFAGLPVMKEKK